MHIRKYMLLLLTLLVILPQAVSAEVRKGDFTEEVKELQTLLFEAGYLTSQPDGIFGDRTEAAVKAYQADQGLPQTGVADDALIERLRGAEEAPSGGTGQADAGSGQAAGGADPSGSPAGPDKAETQDYCTVTLQEDRSEIICCAAHQEILRKEQELLQNSSGPDYAGVIALWETEIDELYKAWITEAAPEKKLEILSSAASFRAAEEAQKAFLAKTFPGNSDEADRQLILFLKDHAVMLCGMKAIQDDIAAGGEGA